MIINKDTSIYGSFAKKAGNKGCVLFNNAFEFYGMNAIYKSFSVNNIKLAVEAARALNIKGFAVTMPYKTDVLKYVDERSEEVDEIGAANTVTNKDGCLKAYNTDYLAAKTVLSEVPKKPLYILGDGGYSKAVQYAARAIGLEYEIIKRSNWAEIGNVQDSIVYNCTPVTMAIMFVSYSNKFIDCSVDTDMGRRLGKIQAGHQFELYTGEPAPQGVFCR
jgi:shikimate dehydrogenase